MLHEIAGEDGLGWNARLAMIHAAFESNGTRGFPLPIAKFLATKYGYAAERMTVARAQVVTTFLTPLSELPEADGPALTAPVRAGFAAARDELAAHVPEVLRGHRMRMFARHLAWPITL